MKKILFFTFVAILLSSASTHEVAKKANVISIGYHSDLCEECNALKAKMKKMNVKFFSSPIVFIKYDKTNPATQKKAEKELLKWNMLDVAKRDDGLKYVILYHAATKEKLDQINYDDDIQVMEEKIRQALDAASR